MSPADQGPQMRGDVALLVSGALLTPRRRHPKPHCPTTTATERGFGSATHIDPFMR